MRVRTKIGLRILPLGLGVALALTVAGGTSLAAPSTSHTAAPVTPQSTEAEITRLTTRLFEKSQFAHHPFDADLAGTLIDRYMDSLDPTRSVFLQSDADEFAAFRPTLAQSMRQRGDMRAAQAIFDRYLKRLGERVTYITEQLHTTKFDFTKSETYSTDREHTARPRDVAAARDLWRQSLRADVLKEKLGNKQPDQIVNDLSARYAQQLRTMQSIKSDEVMEGYLDGFAHVYDPHSEYLGHEAMDSLSIAMNLSLSGIGAVLESVDGCCRIREVNRGGPAAKSGLLHAGDRIVAVAQQGQKSVDVVDMPVARAADLIRGPRGSKVTLTVVPRGNGTPPKPITIVRENVKLEDQEAKARIVELPNPSGGTMRLGIIDLPAFYADIGNTKNASGRSATTDVEKLLAKLKTEHVRGIVLDLRHNGGGSLAEGISLTGLFFRQGPVVQTKDQDGKVDVEPDIDPAVQWDGPMIVLTSKFTASASEILTGALQDYGRALVVGDSTTFGKGTVQHVLQLGRVMDDAKVPHAFDPGAVEITTSKFYRPNGASTQLRGVAADVVLPSTTDFPDFGESSMKDPLPWDSVTAAPHEQQNRVAPYVKSLRDKSEARRKTDKDFDSLADDIARLKKVLTTKTISLNEAERRQEQTQNEAREKAREQERRVRLAKAPPFYEITLKNASAPGLPRANVTSTSEPGTPEAAAERMQDETVLHETLRILGDYVEALPAQTASLKH